MKAVGVTLHAVVLVLVVIGVTFVGALLGEVLLGAHGGKFFDLKQQLLIACMLIVIGTLLPVFARWSLTELAAAAVLAQTVVVLVIAYTSGWGSFDWMWRLTRFTTLPFAVALTIGYVLRQTQSERFKKEANQPPQRNAGSRPPSDDSPASETPSSLGPRG